MRRRLVITLVTLAMTLAATAFTTSGTSPAAAVPSDAPPGAMQSVTPSRLVDTRITDTPLTASETRSISVAGTHAVPDNATAVVLNVTVTRPTATGYLSVWPGGAPRPVPASTLNFVPGQTVATQDQVQLGAGAFNVYINVGRTDLVVDVTGSSAPVARLRPGDPDAHRRQPESPSPLRRIHGPDPDRRQCRRTRRGHFSCPRSRRDQSDRDQLPHAVWRDSVYRCTAPATHLLHGERHPRRPVANLVTAAIGTSGSVNVYNQLGTVDFAIDVIGYYVPLSGSVFTAPTLAGCWTAATA